MYICTSQTNKSLCTFVHHKQTNLYVHLYITNKQSIMKTKEIEIYDISKVKGGYEAEYEFEGNDVTLLISDSELIDFIIDNELNMIETFNEQEKDIDQYYEDPNEMLEVNYFDIVSQYLNDLHKC